MMVTTDRLATYVLRHADDNLVLAQRLGEWISRGPELEEDIALGNIALDHLGVARYLLQYAAELLGDGWTEDRLAFDRTDRQYTNALLFEQPNGDFATTMARQLFVDAYQVPMWEAMADTADAMLAAIAGKAVKEATYHLRHSSTWVIRLGDGTRESHQRMQSAVDALWRFTGELLESDELERQLGDRAVDMTSIAPEWRTTVARVLDEATLALPDDPFQRSGGRSGIHSEHLGFLLAEMQWMQRTFPGLEW